MVNLALVDGKRICSYITSPPYSPYPIPQMGVGVVRGGGPLAAPLTSRGTHIGSVHASAINQPVDLAGRAYAGEIRNRDAEIAGRLQSLPSTSAHRMFSEIIVARPAWWPVRVDALHITLETKLE